MVNAIVNSLAVVDASSARVREFAVKLPVFHIAWGARATLKCPLGVLTFPHLTTAAVGHFSTFVNVLTDL